MKKIKLEKFKILELKNPQSIVGGGATGGGSDDGGDTGTDTLKMKCEQNSDVIIWE